ncbi:MAG TPA: rod shape-determining protein MreC [Nitrospiria bacterium]|jgi:rod shape-determining protein MreC|nr:rod shape-determining protein MreC [Nitrospiria bacterium]
MLRQIINYRRFIILFLTVLLVAVLLFPELQRRPVYFLGRPVVFLISGLQKGLTWTAHGIGGLWNGYINLISVQRENETLKRDLARLQNETLQLQEAAQANERLEQLLNFRRTNAFHTLVAAVIGRDPSNWYRTLMIDKGTREGVAIDMGVITPVGVVGRVIKADPTVSQVLLVTDRNSAVAALIQRTRDEGLVEGTERGLARIKYLSLLADLKEGDLVLTSGLTGYFPKGLLIGTLGRATKKELDLFQQAEVIPSVDFSKLEEVLVVTALEDRIPPAGRPGSPASEGSQNKK